MIPAELIGQWSESIRRGKRPLRPGAYRQEFSGILPELEKQNRELFPDISLPSDDILSELEKRLAGSARQFRFFGGGIRRRAERIYTGPEWDEDDVLSELEKRLAGSARQFRFFGGGIRRRAERIYTGPEWDEDGEVAGKNRYLPQAGNTDAAAESITFSGTSPKHES